MHSQLRHRKASEKFNSKLNAHSYNLYHYVYPAPIILDLPTGM